MPINVVYEYPTGGTLHRFLGLIVSFLPSILGILLILTGLVAATFLILLLFLVFSQQKAFFGLVLSGGNLRAAFVATTIMVVCMGFGFRLMRGKPRLVLFLRRFGFQGATQALTLAVATATESSWRLITLDDAQVAPIGVGKGVRWICRGSGVMTVLIFAAGLYWVFDGGFGKTIETARYDVTSSGDLVTDLIGRFAQAYALVIGVFLMYFLAGVFLGLIVIFSLWTYASVHWAERAKTVEILQARTIGPMARSIVRRSRRVFSPRLMVVRVAPAFWKEAVRRIASQSSAVVVDISEPTESLLWEIYTLKTQVATRWVLVGERDRLANMTTAVPVQSALVRRLFDLLDGEDVLAYASDRRSRKRFARALKAKLDNV